MFKVRHHCWLIYLTTFRICLEIYRLDPVPFFPHQNQHGKQPLKKVRIDILIDIAMFLIVENISQVEYVIVFVDMQKLIKIT